MNVNILALKVTAMYQGDCINFDGAFVYDQSKCYCCNTR